MTLSDEHVQVLTDRELLKEGGEAQVIYDGLKEEVRGSVDADARDLGIVNRVTHRLVGTEEEPGAFQTTITGLLTKHTESIDKTLERAIHEKLDQRGVKQSPQHKPPVKKKKEGDGEPSGDPSPLPEGAVSQEEYDALKQQFHGSLMGNSVVGALGEAKFVNSEARQDAIEHLTRHAKIGEDGKVTIEMEVLNATTKKKELRTMTPETALQALQGTKPHLFAAGAAGGTGGGGGDLPPGGGSGTEQLPAVNSYAELLKNAKLMARYMKEKPDEFRAMKEAHYAGEGGSLANVMSGKGLSAGGLVGEAMDQLKMRLGGGRRQ